MGGLYGLDSLPIDLQYFIQKFALLNIDFDYVLAFKKDDYEDEDKVGFTHRSIPMHADSSL